VSTRIEVVNGPIPQRPHAGTSYIARQSLVLEGSPLSIQEAWAIQVGDGAPLLDMAKELNDRDALCYRQNMWRNGDSAMAHG